MPMKFSQIGEQNRTIISRLEVISGTFRVISQSPPPVLQLGEKSLTV